MIHTIPGFMVHMQSWNELGYGVWPHVYGLFMVRASIYCSFSPSGTPMPTFIWSFKEPPRGLLAARVSQPHLRVHSLLCAAQIQSLENWAVAGPSLRGAGLRGTSGEEFKGSESV